MAKAYVVCIAARLEEVEGHLARGLEHPESNVVACALAALDNDQ